MNVEDGYYKPGTWADLAPELRDVSNRALARKLREERPGVNLDNSRTVDEYLEEVDPDVYIGQRAALFPGTRRWKGRVVRIDTSGSWPIYLIEHSGGINGLYREEFKVIKPK